MSRIDEAEDTPAILGGHPACPDGPPEWPINDPGVAEAVRQALADGSWGRYHGPWCPKLTELLAGFQQCEHVLLCSSGTSAVELALRGCRVEPGDEVVLAAYDYRANFRNVLCLGAIPVLIDIDADTQQMDTRLLEGAITHRTKAVITSHLHGGVVAMPKISEIARSRNVLVIEDACQATGATVFGRRAGMWGDVGVISFGGSKLLTAGRGGAVFGDSAQIMQRIKLHAFRGNDAYPLSELQAAVLIPQLRQLDERNTLRSQNVERLTGAQVLPRGLTPFRIPSDDSHSAWYKLGIVYDSEVFGGMSRLQWTKSMRAEGVAFDPGLRALHRIHSRSRFRAAGELPVADIADERIVMLHHPVLLRGADEMQQIRIACERIRRSSAEIRNRIEDPLAEDQTLVQPGGSTHRENPNHGLWSEV